MQHFLIWYAPEPTVGLNLTQPRCQIYCRDATLFVGSQKTRTSKQLIALRDSIKMPSFVLKSSVDLEVLSPLANKQAAAGS